MNSLSQEPKQARLVKMLIWCSLGLLWSLIPGNAHATINSPPVEHDIESGARSLVETLAPRLKASQLRKIAILPFPDLNGFPSALGDFLAEELITNLLLVAPDDFDVVERSQLARVLSEQELTATGLFDDETIASFGKILGIDALFTGSIAYLDGQIKINARVLSIETARVVAAASVKIKEDQIAESLSKQRSGRSERGASSKALRPAQVQRHDAYFQSDFLRADVRSIGISADEIMVTLSLDLTNTSDESVYIALEGKFGKCEAGLVGDAGESLSPPSTSTAVSGLPCLRGSSRNYKVNYSSLSPGTRITVVAQFSKAYEERGRHRDDSKALQSSIFSFAGNFIRFLGEQPQRFSIGIANIEPPPR